MVKFVYHPASLRSKVFFSIYLLINELQLKLVDFIRVDVCTLFSNCFHASVQFQKSFRATCTCTTMIWSIRLWVRTQFGDLW